MLPSLRQTVENHGLLASKALGQNFLLDRNITDKIIRLSLNCQGIDSFADCHVCEIGPGPGGLTRAIVEAAPASLTVIEMDRRCIEIMEELKAQTPIPFRIINGDALQYDLSREIDAPRQIISNLPYNVSVPLLIGWLQDSSRYRAMTLMFQKEVAERITAPTRCKDYGRLSVLAQLTCGIVKLMDLPPECFTPAPKIWSTVLLFRPKTTVPDKQIVQKVEKITSAAFGQRRKMLRQSLKQFPGLTEKCGSLGISLTARAEELTPEMFLQLAQNL